MADMGTCCNSWNTSMEIRIADARIYCSLRLVPIRFPALEHEKHASPGTVLGFATPP
jgi:hypothetical protein